MSLFSVFNIAGSALNAEDDSAEYHGQPISPIPEASTAMKAKSTAPVIRCFRP